MPLAAFTLTLDNGVTAPAVRVPPGGDLSGLAGALALPTCCGAVALLGGASRFDVPEYRGIRAQVSRLLAELADLAASRGVLIIDGGTPFGVMRLIGQARADQGGGFPLVGVAPAGQVTWAGLSSGAGGETALDVNHSAFVLVEADNWGDEGGTLVAAAYTLAGDHPVLGILINGGDIARWDVWVYLQRGGKLVVIEGSGRFADAVAAAVREGRSDDPMMQTVLATGRVHLFPLSSPSGAFAPWLRRLASW